MPDLREQWQKKLDKEYPHGAMLSWDDPDGADWVPCPRVEVAGMEGLDPVLRFPCFGFEKVLGPWQVLAAQKSERFPDTQEFTFKNTEPPGRSLLVQSRVPEHLRNLMLADRQKSVADTEGEAPPPMGASPGPAEG